MITEPTPLRAVGNGNDGRSTRSPQRSRPDRGLPTDRLRLDAQQELLRAFGRLSGSTKRPIDTPAVAQSVNVSPATAGLCNRFFVDAGWLVREAKGKYTATDGLLEFMRHRGADGSHESTAVRHLADAAHAAWFWERLSSMLADGPVSRRDAIIALSSAAGAEAGHEPQLENVLQWLQFIGLVQIDDDIVRGSQSVPVPADGAEAPGHEDQPPIEPAMKQQPGGDHLSKRTAQERRSSADFVLTFDVSVRMTADDLATLDADQIRALYEAIGKVAAITART